MKQKLILKNYKGNEAKIEYNWKVNNHYYYEIIYKTDNGIFTTKEVIKYLKARRFEDEEIDKFKEWILISRL